MLGVPVPWSLGAVTRCPTPHQRPRQPGVLPRLVVLHCDAGRTEAGSIEWIASERSAGAYHVLIGRDGRSYRFVADERCAYHAGRAEWQGVSAVNDLSLGLCFANRNDGTELLTEPQIRAAQFWIAYWAGKYHLEAVTTHAAVARPVGRKSDPDGLVTLADGRQVKAAPNFNLAWFTGILAPTTP